MTLKDMERDGLIGDATKSWLVLVCLVAAFVVAGLVVLKAIGD